MKKKFITGGIVVAFLCLIGYTGTRYANEIILWVERQILIQSMRI